jgi:hypothetical protein
MEVERRNGVELSQTDGDVALGDVRSLTRGATSHGAHMSVAAHQGNVRQGSRFPPKHTLRPCSYKEFMIYLC